MPGGNAVKIAIVVVGIGIAITVFALTRKAPEPERKAEVKDLVCTKCQAHIQMPIPEFDKAISEAPMRENPAAGSESGGPRARSAVNLPRFLKCPKCSEDALLAAAKCPNSDTWYPVVNADGTRGKCPE